MAEQEEFAAAVQAAMAADEKSQQPVEPIDAKAEVPAPVASDDGKGEAKVAEPEQAKQPATTEDKTEQVAAPEQKDWSAKLEAERVKSAARNKLKAIMASQAKEMESLKQRLAKYEQWEARKAQDPLAAAEEAGIPLETLSKAYIKRQETEPNADLSQKIHLLEERIEKQSRELQAQQAAKLVADFEKDVKNLLEAKSEMYELTKTAEEGTEVVKAIVGAHWQQTAKFDSAGNLVEQGETMSVEEACRLAEDYFENKQLKRFATTKKFKSMFQVEPAKAKVADVKAQPMAALTQALRQGGGEQTRPTYGDEAAEIMDMVRRYQAQQPGN